MDVCSQGYKDEIKQMCIHTSNNKYASSQGNFSCSIAWRVRWAAYANFGSRRRLNRQGPQAEKLFWNSADFLGVLSCGVELYGILELLTWVSRELFSYEKPPLATDLGSVLDACQRTCRSHYHGYLLCSFAVLELYTKISDFALISFAIC